MNQPLPIPLPWERGFSPFTGELEGSEVSPFRGRFRGGCGAWAYATWSVSRCSVEYELTQRGA